MNHHSTEIITSSYNKAFKPINIYIVWCKESSLIPTSSSLRHLIAASESIAFFRATATNSSRCLSGPLCFYEQQMLNWKKKRVKTGSWSGSFWCRELVYFWRSRGRARAVSFLVFYSFLYKLEFDSELLVTFTPDAIVPLTSDLKRFAAVDSPVLLSSCRMQMYFYSRTFWINYFEVPVLHFRGKHLLLYLTATVTSYRIKVSSHPGVFSFSV